MKRGVFLCVAVPLVPLALAGTAVAQFSAQPASGEAFFTGLGDLPGGQFSSSARGISADGMVVVGGSSSATGSVPFRWTSEGGMISVFDDPQIVNYATAVAVSSDGSAIAGYISPGTALENRAFQWTETEGVVFLGDVPGFPPGTAGTEATGISQDGSAIVGYAAGTSATQAYRWTVDAGMSGLGFLPGGQDFSLANAISADGEVVVGAARSDVGLEAFRWTLLDGMVVLGDLDGGLFRSGATGVSADGTVIVGSSGSGLGHEAFRWTDQEGMVPLGDLPGGEFDSFALHVSPDGSVVLGIGSTDRGDEAFIWDSKSGMHNLLDFLVQDWGLDLTGWRLSVGTGVSADGLTVVGYGINPDGNREAWIAHIPEPTSLCLLSVSALMCCMRPRSRAKKV